jgi:electron transport complex protein RnfE
LPDLNDSLGVFISLIVVNCIILARAEAFASKNGPLPSFIDGISIGLGFTLALSILGFIRELLGSASVLGFKIPFIQGAQFFITPAGAFVTLGCLIAAVVALKSRKKKTPSPVSDEKAISDNETEETK